MPRNVRGSVEIHSEALESETLPIFRRAVNEVARDIEHEAKRIVPVRTGHTRSTIHANPARLVAPWHVQATVDAGGASVFLQEGTRAHLIRARRAKALRFYWDRVGRVVFYRSVHHPGTTANPFMTIAAERVAARHR